LAERLGKTLEELSAITVDEFVGWIAYMKILEDKKSGKI